MSDCSSCACVGLTKVTGGNPLGRYVVFKKAHETVMKKTNGNYPAPLAILDVVRCVAPVRPSRSILSVLDAHPHDAH